MLVITADTFPHSITEVFSGLSADCIRVIVLFAAGQLNFDPVHIVLILSLKTAEFRIHVYITESLGHSGVLIASSESLSDGQLAAYGKKNTLTKLHFKARFHVNIGHSSALAGTCSPV